MTEQHPMIVAMAKAIDPSVWGLHDLFRGNMSRLDDWHRADHAKSLRQARAALTALLEPGNDAWDGLARQIVMWMDFGQPTPRRLFKHLTSSGREIPQWLRDEPEMKNLDHVPSKGTRAMLIFTAMIQHVLTDPRGAGQTTTATTKGER